MSKIAIITAMDEELEAIKNKFKEDIMPAGKPAGVKAPVVKFRHHLALGYILVQAAVILGAAVLGMFLGKSREAFLSHLTFFPHFQK